MRPAWFTVGVLLLALAASLEVTRHTVSPKIASKIKRNVIEQVVWQPESPPSVQERYMGYSDPSIYARFYLLNVTNVEDVRHGGIPALQEVGPYTFTKHRHKLDVQFSPDNSTVAYNDFFYYLPVPELTNGTLDDAITTLNVPLVGAIEAIEAHVSSSFSGWLQLLARLVEGWRDHRVAGLFTTRTAGELLFGYDDPLLARAARLIPGVHINPTFALVRNMSAPEDSGPTDRAVVATGAHGRLADTWTYRSWHGVQAVRAWAPPHVEEVRGTDATQFRPGLEKGAAVDVWVGEAFRAVRLLEGEGPGAGGVSVHGVPVLRFRPDPAQREPDPRYYQDIQGLMNVTVPMATGPEGPQEGEKVSGPMLFLSLPGYCGADERLVEGVEGIECDPQRHDLYIDVEPTSGVTLRAKKCLMLSSWYGSRYAAVDSNVIDTVLPIFWAEETSEADASQLKGFRKMLMAQLLQKFLDHAAAPLTAAAAFFGVGSMLVGALVAQPVATWHDEEEAIVGERDPLMGGGGAALPAVGSEATRPTENEEIALQSDDKD